MADPLEVVHAVRLRDVVSAAKDVEDRGVQLRQVALVSPSRPGIRPTGDDAAVLQDHGLDRGSCPTLSASSPPQLFPDAAIRAVSIRLK